VFLQDDLDRTLSIIKKWTVNENAHIRRLASEGTRPRLPWAVRVKTLLEKPSHCFPILQDLKADNEKYVQKSVANHLNDISKDHPEIMLQLVKSWDNTNQSTQWIIRHAARTLVKKGNRQALALFGAGRKPQINLRKFALNTSRLQLGDNLEFELELVSCAKKEQQLIIDYRIHYVKASGHTSPKVFKLKTATLKPGQPLTLRKKHPVKNFTTRKHYSGRHLIELLINGRSINSLPFQLDATRAR
jgi:3-methyladenine DNA glycosylase AlkC